MKRGGRLTRRAPLRRGRPLRRASFKQVLAQSSIGDGLRDIKERGIDAHLETLDREMAKPWLRKPTPTRGTSYARRERDDQRAEWTRRQVCACDGPQPDGVRSDVDRCRGATEAHHAGVQGYGNKADDSTLVPLCEYHHRSITGVVGGFGCFTAWTREERRAWQDAMIERYQARYDGHLRALATFLL